MMTKDVAYYMSLPYVIEMQLTEDGNWFVRIPMLEGLMTYGSTRLEALEMLDEAKEGWFEVMLEAGATIPEPQPEPMDE